MTQIKTTNRELKDIFNYRRRHRTCTENLNHNSAANIVQWNYQTSESETMAQNQTHYFSSIRI